MSFRRLLTCAATALLLLAAGCAGSQRQTAAPATTSTSAADLTTSTLPVSTSASTATVAPTATIDGRPKVVLERGGLGVLTPPSPIRHLEIGKAESAALRTALVAALGDPKEEMDEDCPSGPVRSLVWPALSVYTSRSSGTLAGWYVPPGATPRLTTADGIGLGTKLAEIRKIHPDVKVTTTSLGPEMSIGPSSGYTLSGVLTSASPSGRVMSLFSGDACVQR